MSRRFDALGEGKNVSFQSTLGGRQINDEAAKRRQNYLIDESSDKQRSLNAMENLDCKLGDESWVNKGDNDIATDILESNEQNNLSNNGLNSARYREWERDRRQQKMNQTLQVVEIDALVWIKILKDARDHYPSPITGQLLGLDFGSRLEITNCFLIPSKEDLNVWVQKYKMDRGDIDDRIQSELEKYQFQMTESLHEVHVDCFTVGWYQSLGYSDMKDTSIIEGLCMYQAVVDKAIVLGFDPLRHSTGRCGFKAFGISAEFAKKFRESDDGGVSLLGKYKRDDILIEIPIDIRYPVLSELFLLQWALTNDIQSSTEYESLDIDPNNYVEKSLRILTDSMDDLSTEQDRLLKYQKDKARQQHLQKQIIERRRIENEQRRLRGESLLSFDFDGSAFRKIDPPNHIPVYQMTQQVSNHCQDLLVACGTDLCKVFLLNETIGQK